jgi:feruloyl esterase
MIRSGPHTLCQSFYRHRRLPVFAVLFGASVVAPMLVRATACESLTTLALSDTKITLAQSVLAGTFTPPAEVILLQPPAAQANPAIANLPAFCRVTATIKPAKHSEIRIEVWLPTTGWNGRLLGVGNGGWGGTIAYGALAEGLRQRFAAASTDTGHSGKLFDASFAFGHRERLIDFGYRSVHLMTVKAKAIIVAFYGTGPHFSYWNGCSTGGKQGLTEAQRFPDDYNGIVAGDPANFFTHLMFGTMWPAFVTLKNSADYIPPSKYLVVHQAVLKACDALDGVADGILYDPTQCHFDPKTLECKVADGPDCLTPSQVQAIRRIYAGAKNPRTGEQIFPGLEPGSQFDPANGPQPGEIPVSYFQFVLFKKTNWKWQTLNYDSDVVRADKRDGEILNAIDPDLKAFKAHGGKLLMYHGWSDPTIAPLNTVNYYENVMVAMGGAKETQDFARLFMVPGMAHCRGGPGPDVFDKVGVLEQWVENGIAPDRITASHLTGRVADMTRPLCPYPEVCSAEGNRQNH